MKVMFKRKLYEEMIKAFGKKDLSKLRKEIVTDKNGHKKTVYKKIDKQEVTTTGYFLPVNLLPGKSV